VAIARATAAGAASAYFNPAFLTLAPPSLEAGVFVLNDRISIRLDERPASGADIPVGFQNAASATGASFPGYGLPTSWLESGNLDLPPRPRQQAGSSDDVRSYLVLGGVLHWFEGRLALGVYTMIPSGEYTGASAFFVDEREQYFTNSLHAELYSDRLTATSLALGVGVRLSERLSLGLAATLALAAKATTPTFLNDISRFRDLRIDAEVGVDVKLAPHAGLVYQLSESLRLAATLHTPQKFEVVIDFTFLVANGIYQRAQIGCPPLRAAAARARRRLPGLPRWRRLAAVGGQPALRPLEPVPGSPRRTPPRALRLVRHAGSEHRRSLPPRAPERAARRRVSTHARPRADRSYQLRRQHTRRNGAGRRARVAAAPR
jgi:hypothetical protein